MPPSVLVLALYFIVLGCLTLYGLHRSYLVYVYMKRRAPAPPAAVPLEPLPPVTVQLPIFNEMYVAERLIEAAGRLDYPVDRLEIQVLDDSTDETCHLARRAVERLIARGLDAVYLHRDTRHAFKAGALTEGLARASGAFVAIFDADFVPEPDFLRRVMPAFADAAVGMVQARWGHLNADYSVLTRVQSMLLDAHFVLEHGGRSRAGCFFNFNGTAGVWRRTAIETAGGWQHDTLTEDLDLSYRAQLAGWRFVFLPDLVAPAELPVDMDAFKSQQHRWAKGSIQTCRKLLPRLLGADLPRRVKLEAAFHLTANVNYVLVLALALLVWPATAARHASAWPGWTLLDVSLFGAAIVSIVSFYAVSQREIGGDWRARLRYLPALLSIGIGLSVNNSRAVVDAFRRRRAEFVRTPKYGVVGHERRPIARRYPSPVGWQPLVEVALGLYCTAAVLHTALAGSLATLPFLILFQIGFLYTGLVSLVQQSAFAAVPDELNLDASRCAAALQPRNAAALTHTRPL